MGFSQQDIESRIQMLERKVEFILDTVVLPVKVAPKIIGGEATVVPMALKEVYLKSQQYGAPPKRLIEATD